MVLSIVNPLSFLKPNENGIGLEPLRVRPGAEAPRLPILEWAG
jgi:hypothetical protein